MGTSGGDQEEFCLRWNDFEENISSAFRHLRNDPDFCDVRLAVKDRARPLRAHKVILASCSPYFNNLLKDMNSESGNPNAPFYVMMRGVTSTQLSLILDFMYYGEANVAQEDLDPFLALAEELQVRGLTKQNTNGSNQTHRDTAAANTRDTSASHHSQLQSSAARKRQVPHHAADHPTPSAMSASAASTPAPKKPRRQSSPPRGEDEEYKATPQPRSASIKTEHADQSLEVDPEHEEFGAYDDDGGFDDEPLDEGGDDPDFDPGEGTSGSGAGGGGGGASGHNEDDKGVKEVGRWAVGESWSTFEWTPERIRKDYILKMGDEYQCKICNCIRKRLDTAERHVLSFHLTGTAKCPLCDKMGTRRTIRDHVSKDHNMYLNIFSMKLTGKRI